MGQTILRTRTTSKWVLTKGDASIVITCRIPAAVLSRARAQVWFESTPQTGVVRRTSRYEQPLIHVERDRLRFTSAIRGVVVGDDLDPALNGRADGILKAVEDWASRNAASILRSL